ncbi:MAG TPA: hypothetical protein PLY87_25205, partial [Planctomycetaceae bacterium]|nr:hypothetical protein [Planctomycetaceae bacterium]
METELTSAVPSSLQPHVLRQLAAINVPSDLVFEYYRHIRFEHASLKPQGRDDERVDGATYQDTQGC